MKLKNLKCPLCGNDTAKQSSTYMDMAVCYCGGSTLNEVGAIKNGTIQALQKPPVFNRSLNLTSIHFDFQHLSQKDEVMEAGRIFSNALSDSVLADKYMNEGEIWVAKYDGELDHDFSVIFLITHDDRLFKHYYLKKNGSVPQGAASEIRKFLIDNGLALGSI